MFKRLWVTIDCFLFTPISANAVCIFRIGLGLSTMAAAIMRYPDFLMWYGERGLTPYADVTDLRFVFSAWNFIEPTDKNLEILLVLFLLAGLCLTIGLFSRFSTLSAYFLYTSFRTRNPSVWLSIDAALYLFLPLMIIAPIGEKFSVDQLIRKEFSKKFSKDYREKLHSPFAQRLMQFVVTGIYIRGFSSKIVTRAWTTGENGLNYSIHSDWIKHGLPRIFENHWFYLFATGMTLGIELSLFTLIWFKETRYWTLAVGVFFHLLLNYAMNIDFLEYAVIASYVLFIYPEDLERILQRFNLKPSPVV
ncbi:MAG: HTTM domain-containing protein [Candidatus Obscuribacterales bacterium]|nr:HTTM domain-containing protein [Candidatus Obscuribacterales bacterium]